MRDKRSDSVFGEGVVEDSRAGNLQGDEIPGGRPSRFGYPAGRNVSVGPEKKAGGARVF